MPHRPFYLVTELQFDSLEHIDPKVVLVDGRRLAELMIDFEVGVATARIYHVKRVDSDYFEEA